MDHKQKREANQEVLSPDFSTIGRQTRNPLLYKGHKIFISVDEPTEKPSIKSKRKKRCDVALEKTHPSHISLSSGGAHEIER